MDASPGAAAGPSGGGAEVVKPSSPATVPPVPAARNADVMLFGRWRVDGDDRVIRSQPRAVGERDLHPGSQVRRLTRIDGGRIEAAAPHRGRSGHRVQGGDGTNGRTTIRW